MSDNMVTEATTFEDAALLRTNGLAFERAENRGRRVAVLFADPSGQGARLLQEHRTHGVSVNSRDFEDSLNWAKKIIFTTKDAAA